MSGETVMVTMRDVYVVEGCAPGALKFLRRHRLDAHRFFLRGGLPAEQLEATGDAMALRVVRAARARAAGTGG